MAKRAELRQGHLSDIEIHADAGMEVRTLQRIAEAIGVTMDELTLDRPAHRPKMKG